MGKKNKETELNKKGKILDIVLTSIGALLLLISTVSVIYKFVDKDNMLFGVRSDIVLTSSMATINEELEEEYKEKGWTNQLKVHDWIFTAKVNDENELKIGDIATYRHPFEGLVTHRIVNIKEINGTKYYTFKGDAVGKKGIDGDFAFDKIVGKVTNNAGQFGQVIYFFQTIYGVILLVGLAMICLVYSFLSDRAKKKTQTQNEKDI